MIILVFHFALVCPPDYIEGPNYRCYKLYFDPTSWTNARTTCQDSFPGADLVIFNDQAENEFIASVANGTIWWVGKLADIFLH